MRAIMEESIGNEDTLSSPENKSEFRRDLAVYGGDVGTAYVYYTLAYGLQEAGVSLIRDGKIDLETIATNRGLSLVGITISMYPTQKVGQYVARRMNITKDSPFIDKWKHRFISITPIQSIMYGAALTGGMILANDHDLEKAAGCWAIGAALSALHSFPYCWARNKIRKWRGYEDYESSKESFEDPRLIG